MKQTRLSPAVVVIISGVVAALHIGKMPPAIPVLREALGMTLLEAGFLLSMVQVAGMTTAALIGLTTDSLGLKRSATLGQCILAVASLVGIWATRPSHLLILRAIEGFGFLLAVLPAPGLVRELVPMRRLAHYLGFWGAYMPTGTAAALVAAPAFIHAIGWTGFWGVLAVCSGLMAIWLFFAIPSDRQRRAKKPPSADTSEPWWQRLRLTLSQREPWRIAIIFGLYAAQWMALIGFLPSIYMQAGMSAQTTGSLIALFSLVNIIGNIAAGRWLHRGTKAKNLLYLGFVTMGICAFLAFSVLTVSQPLLRYLSILTFSAVGGLIPGTLFWLAVHVAPNERTVLTTVGWMQQFSSGGQFVSPPIVAWLASLYGGWHLTWVVTGAACVLGLLFARGAKPTVS